MSNLPWNGGGKEECLDYMAITMSHQELENLLGESAKIIANAGFVLVPRKWRDNALDALTKKEPVTK